MTLRSSLLCPLLALAPAALLAAALPAAAQSAPPASVAAAPTYADLVALADGTPLVVRAQIRKQTQVEAARAPGLAAGHARLYVEARTLALLGGSAPLGESLRYLVDVPLDAKGKVPNLKKREVLLFARPVAGKPDQLQLAGKAGQLAYDAALETRLRAVLAELVAPDAPPRLAAVRDALAVPGTLAGESETQIFIDTVGGETASITVARRPDQPVHWGVSWSEVVDQAARPPERGTLAWYRLACGLPQRLPASANLAQDAASRTLAARDYALVLQALGSCERKLAL